MFTSEMEQTMSYVAVLSRMEHRVVHSMWHEYDCKFKIMIKTGVGGLLDS